MKIRSQSQSLQSSPNVTRTQDPLASTRINPFTPMEVSTITNFRIKNRPTSTPLLSSLAASPNTTQNIAIAKLLDENRPKTIARATRSNNIFRELVKERKMSQILVNDTKDKIAKMDLDATTPNALSRRTSSLFLRDEIEKTYKPNIGVIYSKKHMNIGKEKKYKFVITQLENMEYEKKKANEVVKYIFNRPLSRNSEAGTILGSEKQNVSLPVSAPVTARALAPKAVEVEKIRPESTKELREIVSWSKYNRNQVKNLKKNVSMVMRKVETNKKASEKFSIENILKGKEATSPITPFKSPKKIFISKEQSVENRIEMNRKLSDLLKDYPKGNAGITSDKLNCPHFALSNNHNLEEIEKMAKKNPDLKIDAARLEDSKNILQGPNFRDSLTRIDKKLKARALSLGDLTSRATKEQIEKAIVTIVKSNKANKHLRTPSPPKTKDKIFIEFDSALSHRNLKNTTARPALTETEVMKSVQRLNDDLKRISTSCDKYIDNSIKFNGQMKRKVRRIKKSLNKLDRKMLGREYPIDRDIKKQIYKEIDNPTVYLAIKREEKRRRPLVLGLN